MNEALIPELELFYAHTLASLVGFVTVIAAQFLTSKAIYHETGASQLMRYRMYSLVSGIVSTLLLIVFLLTYESSINGLTERLFIAVPLIWIGVSGTQMQSVGVDLDVEKKSG